MNTFPVVLGLLDPLYKLFGFIIGHLYDWIGNYGLVIIIFTIFIRAALIPMGIKTQKGMLKQQGLQDDINEIKRLYPKDPQMQQQLQAELFKKHGISMTGGCLTPILQLLIIIPVFRLFSQPLLYIARVSAENIASISQYLLKNNVITESIMKSLSVRDIPVISALQENASALAYSVEKGLIRLDQVLELDFLGIDLGAIPTWRPNLLFGAESAKYLPLLILPALTMLTMFFQMRISKLNMSKPGLSKEELAREKRNPAKAGQTQKNQAGSMMKSMNIVMPIIMLFTMFTLPSAMGIYWFVGNVMGIIQALITYHFYTKPMREAEAAENAVYDKRRK